MFHTARFVCAYRRVVLNLGTTFVVSLASPPIVIFPTFSFGFGLKVPRSVVTKVANFTIPRPRRGLPVSRNMGTLVGHVGILVKVITEHATCRSFAIHHKGINLSITQTVAGQKVVLGSHGAVFHVALHTHVNTEGTHENGPDPVASVRTFTVFAVASVEFGVESGHVARVTGQGKHDKVGMLRVDLDNLFETTTGEGTKIVGRLFVNVNGNSLRKQTDGAKCEYRKRKNRS